MLATTGAGRWGDGERGRGRCCCFTSYGAAGTRVLDSPSRAARHCCRRRWCRSLKGGRGGRQERRQRGQGRGTGERPLAACMAWFTAWCMLHGSGVIVGGDRSLRERREGCSSVCLMGGGGGGQASTDDYRGLNLAGGWRAVGRGQLKGWDGRAAAGWQAGGRC